MTIDTIIMDADAARRAYREYQAAVRQERTDVRSRWRDEDMALMQAYRQLAKGRAVLDVGAALQSAGLRDDGYPKLAICASHLQKVYCHLGSQGSVRFSGSSLNYGRGQSIKPERIEFPDGTLPKPTFARYYEPRSTIVPMIPPPLRPKTKLEGFHTLWEVDSWTLEPPRDPLLLKHITGTLYAVVAVWDLTDLERAVLGEQARRARR